MSISTVNDNSNTWEYEEVYHPPFLPLLALFPPLAPFFWDYHVLVNQDSLQVGYSVGFHRSIDRKFIQKAEKLDYINGLTQWGGWGYRTSLDMNFETGYIATNGPGIGLSYKDTEEGKDKVITFNCAEADVVCRMLNTPVINAVVH
ncbi:expressed unknown protein [Seminavis robusta]|uniref:Uncharacterized protein n=1 Tax=Seminavis robusta TaxID=568900 RepID=A0A9N8H0Y1_9STRA|nr:expressed unknown protein [Seminavis robusta]|eukprot:Sro29_g019210.1 n/a (146) ;mRNA; r:101093-101530